MASQLIFPPGVVTASPFTSLPIAVEWLSQAASGRLGDFGPVTHGFGFAGRWTVDPIYTADLPENLLVIDGTDGVALNESPNFPFVFAVNAAAPTIAERRRELPSTAVTLAPEYPAQRPQTYLDLYRRHLGYEHAARQHFDAAPPPERRSWAPRLGYFERAVATTADQFVYAANYWVTAVWIDAVNAGVPVSPASLSHVPSPGGSFTLVTS